MGTSRKARRRQLADDIRQVVNNPGINLEAEADILQRLSLGGNREALNIDLLALAIQNKKFHLGREFASMLGHTEMSKIVRAFDELEHIHEEIKKLKALDSSAARNAEIEELQKKVDECCLKFDPSNLPFSDFYENNRYINRHYHHLHDHLLAIQNADKMLEIRHYTGEIPNADETLRPLQAKAMELFHQYNSRAILNNVDYYIQHASLLESIRAHELDYVQKLKAKNKSDTQFLTLLKEIDDYTSNKRSSYEVFTHLSEAKQHELKALTDLSEEAHNHYESGKNVSHFHEIFNNIKNFYPLLESLLTEMDLIMESGGDYYPGFNFHTLKEEAILAFHAHDFKRFTLINNQFIEMKAQFYESGFADVFQVGNELYQQLKIEKNKHPGNKIFPQLMKEIEDIYEHFKPEDKEDLLAKIGLAQKEFEQHKPAGFIARMTATLFGSHQTEAASFKPTDKMNHKR